MADKRISQLVDRGTVANNDVVPIVVSGATTTNKATISSIQTYMQGNLDLGVTSVGITIGSTGTDVNVTGSPVTSSGNITINIPDASTSARGVVTTGAQNFAGNKSFQNTIFANAGVRLDQNGTALPTFVQNISGTGLSTTGANGVGFNNSNNFFFAGSDKGCAVFEVNNTGTRTYTLPDASGTLAFTSDLTGFVTLNTAQTITAQKTFTTSGSSDTMIISHGSGSGFALDVLKAGNGEAIRVTKSSGTGNAMTISGGNFEAGTIVKTGGTSSQFLKADGSVDSNTYLTTGTAGSTYVPYFGATSNVDLGVNTLTSSSVILNGSGSNAGIVHLESNAFFSLVNGYGSIASGTTNQFNFYQTTGAGVFRGAILSLNSITASATRTYTLPDTSGTLALSSDLGAYLPLAGGTLTGALNGTSAVFSISTNAVTDVLSIRNTNAGTSSVARFNIGNNLSPNAFTIKTFSSTHSTKPFISQIINEFDANLELGGFGATALSLGSGGAATFSSSVTAASARFTDTVPIIVVANSNASSPTYGASQIYRQSNTIGNGVGISLGMFNSSNANTETSYLGTIITTNTAGAERGDLAFYTTDNGSLRNERMRITSGGNVLVGPASDSAGVRLKVAGGIIGCVDVYNNTTGVAANMQIDANGFMGRSTVSSIRFKEEIEDWTGGLDIVMALKPRTFKYKKDYYDKADVDFLGLIAEEVSEVCPYLVDYENEDRTGQEENVRYANIVVPLIKAIQELKTQIDSLKNQMQ